MTDSNQSLDDPPVDEPEAKAETNFWSDHLLQYNPSFTLGHPYLQGQWGQYQNDKRQHLIKSVALVVLLVGLALLSQRFFYMYYYLHYIVPAICLFFGVYSLRRWRKTNAQFATREKQLKAASKVLQDRTTSLVQYSIEDIGQNSMHVLKNTVPNCRIVVEGAKSVPKYCGSWGIRNWRTLAESDRLGMHSEYRSYVTGKLWHGVDHSVALLTDSGSILWFV